MQGSLQATLRNSFGNGKNKDQEICGGKSTQKKVKSITWLLHTCHKKSKYASRNFMNLIHTSNTFREPNHIIEIDQNQKKEHFGMIPTSSYKGNRLSR